MSPSPVILASATAAASAQAKKPEQKDAQDIFLSLLDLGKNTGDFSDSSSENAAPVRKYFKDEDITVLAAPTAQPVEYAKDLPYKPKQENADEPYVDAAKDAAPAEKAAPKANDKNEKPDVPASDKEAVQSAPRSKAADKSDAKNTVKDTTEETAAPVIDKIESKLETQSVAPVIGAPQTVITTADFAQALGQIKQLVDQLLGDFKTLAASGGTADNAAALITGFQKQLDSLLPGAGGLVASMLGNTDDASFSDIEKSLTLLADQVALALNDVVAKPLQKLAIAEGDTKTLVQKLSDLMARNFSEGKAEVNVKPEIALPEVVVTDSKKAAASVIADIANAVSSDTKSGALIAGKNETFKDALTSAAPILPNQQQAVQSEAPKAAAQNNNAMAPTQAAAPVQSADNGSNANSGAGRDSQNHSQQAAASVGAATSASAKTDSIGASTFSRVMTQNAAPLTEQVMVQIKTALRDGSSNIRINLAPEELGRLEIKMHMTADGKTGVTIIADNKTTLEMLQRDARNLEQALNDAGLKSDAGSLSFNLRGGQQDAQSQAFARQHIPVIPPVLLEEEPIDLSVVSANYVVGIKEGVDIKI